MRRASPPSAAATASNTAMGDSRGTLPSSRTERLTRAFIPSFASPARARILQPGPVIPHGSRQDRGTNPSASASVPAGNRPTLMRGLDPRIHQQLFWLTLAVTRGLDPRVHLLCKEMDCRVKPGNDSTVGRNPL